MLKEWCPSSWFLCKSKRDYLKIMQIKGLDAKNATIQHVISLLY